MEVSSENDRERAVTRLIGKFSNSYVVKDAKMLLPQLPVVGFPSDMPGNEIVKVICEKINNSTI